MSDTTIEWTDRTWNPVRGCSRVSPGCDNCYAMGQAHRFSGAGKPFEGLTTIRRGKVDWTGSARFVPEMLGAPLRWKKPQKIFVNSMSDLFHESLSNEEIAAVFGVMAACPQHKFQVLTKRPERAKVWFNWASGGVLQSVPLDRCASMADDALLRLIPRSARALAFAPGRGAKAWPLPNVWLGVSVEDQKTAEERIPLLLECPAAVRFVSAEPLIGPLDLGRISFCLGVPLADGSRWGGSKPLLDWVIVGGESGPGARPFDIAWARSTITECKAASVPVFVKQLGAKPYDVVEGEARVNGTTVPWAKIVEDDDAKVMRGIGLRDKKGGDMSEWPESLRVRQFPEVRRG